jgi:pimeloyl-ACP methyl ester carboxylesterase
MCLLRASFGLSKNTIPNLKDSESTGFKRGGCFMKITKVGLVGLFLFAIMLLSAQVALPQSSRIVTETIMVQAKDPGILLHVRNKRPDAMTQFVPERIVLFVHGASYPSETGFDIPHGGYSWMDYVAQCGWDVYIMDLRGYGRSTRPPEMSKPASENPPLVNTDVAVRDVSAVVDHILARRGVSKINLVGWSWGTVIMGAYTAQNNSKVRHLVLYGPLWLIKGQPPIGGKGPLGAYRTVTKKAARQRGLRGIPTEKQEEISPSAWFDQWWAANLATDPEGARQNPPVLRAPNGIIEDLGKYWMAGKPYYDPSQIMVPTLVIGAEWDMDTPPYMAQEVFKNLSKAPTKRYVMIGEGTHGVCIEKNRWQLFREVQLFLEDR